MRNIYFVVMIFVILSNLVFGDSQTDVSDAIQLINKQIKTIEKAVINQNTSEVKDVSTIVLKHFDKDDFCGDVYSLVTNVRAESPVYQAPYINLLTPSLRTKTYIENSNNFLKLYHKAIDQIKLSEKELAKKKYLTALKILITGVDQYKKMIDLINPEINTKEILKLPDTLKKIVDDAKKDADNIKNKFKDIKTIKEKIEILKQYKNRLIQVTYYMRKLANYTQNMMGDMQKIDYYIAICNNQIKLANIQSFPRKNTIVNIDITPYVETLENIKSEFITGSVTVSQYISTKQNVYNNIKKDWQTIVNNLQENEKISESDSKAYDDFIEKYYTTQTDQNGNAVSLETYDINENVITLKPSTFDFVILSEYVKIKNTFVETKHSYIGKMKIVFDKISSIDLFMEDYEIPSTVTPVNIKTEWNKILFGKSPTVCSAMFKNEGNRTSMLPNGFLSYDQVDITNLHTLPFVYPDMYRSSNNYLVNNISQYSNKLSELPLWYDMTCGYTDKLLERAKAYYIIALTGYRSIPSCVIQNKWSYAVSLLDRDKIISFKNNIKKIYEEVNIFPKKFNTLIEKINETNGSIVSDVSELKKLYQKLLSTKGKYITEKDFDFKIKLKENNTGIMFFRKKYNQIHFIDTYNFLNFIDRELVFLKIKDSEVIDNSENVKNNIDMFLRTLNDNIDFNDDELKAKKSEIKSKIDSLKEEVGYAEDLSLIYSALSPIVISIENNKTDILYNNAVLLKQELEKFKKRDYSHIGNNLEYLYTYLDKIKDGSGTNGIYHGRYLVFQENKNTIDTFFKIMWPYYKDDLLRNDKIFNDFFTPEKIKSGLQEIEQVANFYSSDQYKPNPPRTKFILKNFYITPKTLNGTGEVKIEVEFKNIYNSLFPTARVELVTALGEDMFDIEAKEGKLERNFAKPIGNYYMRLNGNSLIVTFKLLKDSISIENSNLTIPVKEINMRIYIPSTEISYSKLCSNSDRTTKFSSCNGVMINIVNLKYNIKLDTNANGILDSWEKQYKINDDNIDKDIDNDGLTCLEEYNFGTNPTQNDSDNDGINDGKEIFYKLNPLDPTDAELDSDGDGTTNLKEIQEGSDPTIPGTEKVEQVYDNVSYYIAYDPADKTKYVLVMPSVDKIYTHKAGDILHMHRIDQIFTSFPTYNQGVLCFPNEQKDTQSIYDSSLLESECYEVNFFYIQKDIVKEGVIFMLYYKPLEKVYEGYAGNKESFKIVKEKDKIFKNIYSKFHFNLDKSEVIFSMDNNKTE